jgi:hypothetical protein
VQPGPPACRGPISFEAFLSNDIFYKGQTFIGGKKESETWKDRVLAHRIGYFLKIGGDI